MTIIKSIDGSVLFSIEADTLVAAVEAAVKSHANLSYASLSGAKGLELRKAEEDWFPGEGL